MARLREITRERELPKEQGKIELQGGKGNAPRYDFVDLFIYLFILLYLLYYYFWLLFLQPGYEILLEVLYLLVLFSGLF